MLGDRKSRTETKMPWRLLPYDALVHVARVMRYGATKYAARNWERGLPYDETFDSLMRHLTAWYLGEDYDGQPCCPTSDTSGELHLAHVAWNALALLAFTVRGRIDLDDRPCREGSK